jgi:uncharacterized membrane protein YeiH
VGNTGSLVADLIGVAVFAASGASAGVAKRLDIFGVIFVGVVAALGGGVARDLLIGAIPPYAFTHWPYLVVAVVASTLLFFLHPQFDRMSRVVLVFDAAGLGLFSATGTLRARDAGVPVIGACVIGMIAGIGGGLGRDLLTGEIPIVLRREIYAVASLFGAAVVLALVAMHTSRPAAVVLTAAAVFAVRMLALRRKWSAPMASETGLRYFTHRSAGDDESGAGVRSDGVLPVQSGHGGPFTHSSRGAAAADHDAPQAEIRSHGARDEGHSRAVPADRPESG